MIIEYTNKDTVYIIHNNAKIVLEVKPYPNSARENEPPVLDVVGYYVDPITKEEQAQFELHIIDRK